MSKKKTRFKSQPKVTFKTIRSEIMRYGERKFIAVSRKTVVSKHGDTDIINISKGYMYDTEPRHQIALTFPDDVEIIEFVISQLEKCKDRNKY